MRIAVLAVCAALALMIVPGAHAQQKEIKIGFIYDVTGPFAGGGSEPAQVGTKAIVDYFNERGGVAGYKINAIFADAQSKVDVAINEMTRLIDQEKVDIISGVYSSAQCVPMAAKVDAAKKFFWMPVCVSSAVLKGKNLQYVFRPTIHSDQYGDASCSFVAENAAKLADCGISVLDSPTDIMYMVLKYIGKDPNTATEADYRAAAEVFKPIRQYIKTFDNSNYLNAIPNKELCVINNWSGDYATAMTRAKEAGVELNLAYYVPKSGSPAWVDTMCIPSDAASVDNAYKFIEYMLQPEVAAKCSNFTNYANGNAKSKPFLDPAVANNPAVYPDAATMDRLFVTKAQTEEQERALTRVWTDVKSG